MDVNKLVFRGDISAPGEWYGKVEQEGDQSALVLFKRPEARGKAQHVADKMTGVHKGTKLASQFIAGKTISLMGQLQGKQLLQSYLQSAIQTDVTLNNIAALIQSQPRQGGGVNFTAKLDPITGGIGRQVNISWQPDA